MSLLFELEHLPKVRHVSGVCSWITSEMFYSQFEAVDWLIKILQWLAKHPQIVEFTWCARFSSQGEDLDIKEFFITVWLELDETANPFFSTGETKVD